MYWFNTLYTLRHPVEERLILVTPVYEGVTKHKKPLDSRVRGHYRRRASLRELLENA